MNEQEKKKIAEKFEERFFGIKMLYMVEFLNIKEFLFSEIEEAEKNLLERIEIDCKVLEDLYGIEYELGNINKPENLKKIIRFREEK